MRTEMMLRGRASDGPRDNVTIEASSDWDGIVHKLERYKNPEAMQPYYPGRYRWETDHWQWHPGQYVRMYGPRGGKNAGNWVWIDDSMSLDEREALLSVNVRLPSAANMPPAMTDRTQGVVDKTVNTIAHVESLPPRRRGRPATHVLWSKTCPYCGSTRKYYRKTCGSLSCVVAARNETKQTSEVG